MSAKSSRKVSLAKPPTPPRSVEELTKAFGEALGQLGQAEYQAYVFAQQAETLKKQILELNQEGVARKAIDDAAATKTSEAANGNA